MVITRLDRWIFGLKKLLYGRKGASLKDIFIEIRAEPVNLCPTTWEKQYVISYRIRDPLDPRRDSDTWKPVEIRPVGIVQEGKLNCLYNIVTSILPGQYPCSPRRIEISIPKSRIPSFLLEMRRNLSPLEDYPPPPNIKRKIEILYKALQDTTNHIDIFEKGTL